MNAIEKILANATETSVDASTGMTIFRTKVRVGKKGDRVHLAEGFITADGRAFAPVPVCGTRGGLYGTGVAQAITGREITCEKCPAA